MHFFEQCSPFTFGTKMLSVSAHFPKQIRALDAINRLNSYFQIQGNNEKEVGT